MKYRKTKTPEKYLIKLRERVNVLFAKGLCMWCRQRNLDNAGKRHCLACYEKVKINNRRTQERYRQEGKCYRCGNPEGVSRKSKCCRECGRKKTDAERRVKQERKAAGLCVRCAKVRDGYSVSMCNQCRELSNYWARERTRRRKNEHSKRDKV